MQKLIAFVVVVGVACANPRPFINPLKAANAVVGRAAGLGEGLVGGAAGLAEGVVRGVTSLTEGVVGGAAGLAEGVVGGAAGLANGATDVLFGFHDEGKAGYASLINYYTNIGITFYSIYGCCSCPARGVVQRGSPNYSPYSPFSINGVYQIHGTRFCTCPPEFVASVVEAARYSPKMLGHIERYVVPIPVQVSF